jgi:peptide/nickel transport system permease protein
MTRYVFGRLAALVPLLLGVSFIAFTLIKLAPGDPIEAMLGLEADQHSIDVLRQKYGLDQPFIVQYGLWLVQLLHGNLGRSIQTGGEVTHAIGEALLPSAQLAVAALLVSLLIAIPAGIMSATRPNSRTDLAVTFAALCGLSLPSFWLGIILIFLFSVAIPVLPSSGRVAFMQDPFAAFSHLILPAITLGTALAAATMRMTRAAMLEVLSQDYVRTARAKGLSGRSVIYKHALRNALMPIVTVIGVQMGHVLGGVVVTETVFAWPGIGKLTVDAIFARDYPLVLGCVLTTAFIFVLINLLTDLAYTALDPRVSYR